MREGSPRIELNPSTGGGPASAGLPGGSNVIVVGVWMLQPGEDAGVGRRLHEVLAENARLRIFHARSRTARNQQAVPLVFAFGTD